MDDLFFHITIVPKHGIGAKIYEHFVRYVEELNENGKSLVTYTVFHRTEGYNISEQKLSADILINAVTISIFYGSST